MTNYRRMKKQWKMLKYHALAGVMVGMVLGLFVPVHPPLVSAESNYQAVFAIPQSTKGKLEKYYPLAKQLFGKDWKTALAVAEAECNSNRKDWPNCVFGWAKEYSVGWGQINLAQEEGRGRKVHWDKIPGSNLQEKEQWLKNPENNLLAMHLVWLSAGKSFSPWTAFTNGNYKQQLNKI